VTNTNTIASLAALAGKLQTHLSNPFWGPSKKKIFGGCSQRLTLKDFTIASCIRRVASDTSFKEEYFFGAFSILPDTSFLLWS